MKPSPPTCKPLSTRWRRWKRRASAWLSNVLGLLGLTLLLLVWWLERDDNDGV